MSVKRKKNGIFNRNRNSNKSPIDNLKNKQLKEYIEKNSTGIIINAPFGLNPKEKGGKIVLGSLNENTDTLDEFYENPEIMRLQLIMLERVPQNIQWAFAHDTACQTAAFTLSQAIIGATGLTAKSKDDKLKEDIDNYLNSIDVGAIIQQSLKDTLCFTESVYWKDYNKEKGMIIPKWIDYVTLTPITNRFTASKKWVQLVHIDSKMPEKDGEAWKSYEPYLDYYHMSNTYNLEPRDKPVKRHIMQEDVVLFQFFKTPPILGVLDIIIWKKWMQYDAKLSGQKYSTPLIDAAITLPDGYDITSAESQALMDQVSQDLNKLMNFGVLSHPDKVKVTAIAQSGQQYDFIKYLEYSDKQIHKACFVPSNLLEAAGSELATSRTTKDMFIIVVNALRTKYARIFKNLVLENFDFIGRKVDPKSFELIFSEEDTHQQLTQSEEFNAIMQMFDRGIMKDQNEVREYVKKFNIDLPQLSDKDIALQQTQMQTEAEDEEPSEEEIGLIKEIEEDIKKGGGF